MPTRIVASLVTAIALAILMRSESSAQNVSVAQFATPVRITGAQGDLLKNEARALGDRRMSLTAALNRLDASANVAGAADILASGANQELAQVRRTESAFMELTGNVAQRQAGVVYFADIARRYEELTPALRKVDATTYKSMRERTLQTVDANRNAYDDVASTALLTFDLDVRSAPNGATIEYRREGDSFEPNNDPTNATLRGLVKAIWIVRATLARDAREQRYDPYRERSRVLVFDFTRPSK